MINQYEAVTVAHGNLLRIDLKIDLEFLKLQHGSHISLNMKYDFDSYHVLAKVNKIKRVLRLLHVLFCICQLQGIFENILHANLLLFTIVEV